MRGWKDGRGIGKRQIREPGFLPRPLHVRCNEWSLGWRGRSPF